MAHKKWRPDGISRFVSVFRAFSQKRQIMQIAVENNL